ncbi:macro domain-containing protein [Haliangium sp.]|uniref:macro domain-containing protein n=1 Tax=Haliangium sp. TaxID=2663208 RepID=UPI003D12DCB5
MQVHVRRTTLAVLDVDAVVSPANSRGTMGSGIAGVLRHHGGDAIEAEAMEAAPIAVGAALVTRGGALPARHVIHAPTRPEPHAKVDAEHVRRAARAALLAANHAKLQVVAFPGVGPDEGGIDMAEAARAIVEELRAHKREYPETVYLVDTSAEMLAAFETALENSLQGL